MTMFHFALFAVFSAFFGACVGSFLNVCIWRIPRGESVVAPRSHCPHCGMLIPWHLNIPVLSWLLLRGRCASCKGPIAIRYMLVELLTATLFLAVFLKWVIPDDLGMLPLSHPALILVYWLFIGGLVLGTFIDFEHYILPDSVTVGGMVAGPLLSAALPVLHGCEVWWQGLLMSLLGLAAGFGLLWGIVELGKLAWGRKRERFDPPQDFTWCREGKSAVLAVGEDTLLWEDIFSRESDRLVVEGAFTVGGKAARTLVFYHDRLVLDGADIALGTLGKIRGKADAITIPREAMGFGDVKLLGAIGAFLGWQAVLFTIFVSSLLGSVVGLLLIACRDTKTKKTHVIPFGPYLAAAAVIWVFYGPALVTAFLRLVISGQWSVVSGQ